MRSFMILGLVLTLHCGCLSFTAMETGRTVGQGTVDATVSVTSGAYAETSIGGPNDEGIDNEEDAGTEESYGGDYYPVVEVGVVRGVGERTDVGVRISSALFISSSVKHQVIGSKTSRFAASIGVRGGLNPGAALAGGVLYGYGRLPVYLSFHPTTRLALYAVPQYAMTAVSAFAVPPGGERSGTVVWQNTGFTWGVTYGETYRVAVEATHLIGDPNPVPQVSIGFRLRTDW